jgi:hypothetical protein
MPKFPMAMHDLHLPRNHTLILLIQRKSNGKEGDIHPKVKLVIIMEDGVICSKIQPTLVN